MKLLKYLCFKIHSLFYCTGILSEELQLKIFNFWSVLRKLMVESWKLKVDGLYWEKEGPVEWLRICYHHKIYQFLQKSLLLNSTNFKKRLWNVVLGCNLKNDRIILVRFQGKPFNIIVIQTLCPKHWCWRSWSWLFLWRPTRPSRTNTKKRCPFHHRGLNAKVDSQEIPRVTCKFGLRVLNEAGQSLTEFCQENTMVIANTLFQQSKRWPYTWTSPNGHYQNQIDYILCSQRWKKLFAVSKNKTWRWLWITSSAPYCKIHTVIEESRENHSDVA